MERTLESKGIEPGDSVEVVTSDGRVVQGLLMPHHEFSDERIVTVKLKSGYNVGVEPRGEDAVRLIEKADKKTAGRKAKIASAESSGTGNKGSPSQALPPVSIVSTGGTIASYVDYRTGAVKPVITADELARSVPELASICSPKTEVLYSVLSENMRPENWRNLAERVAAHLNDGSRGCIVPQDRKSVV